MGGGEWEEGRKVSRSVDKQDEMSECIVDDLV